jgi:hypothetical protein
MGLDFYNEEDRLRKNLLFRIREKELPRYERGFNEFEKKTGVFLDPYGSKRLTVAHLQLLRQLMPNEKDFHPFKEFLDRAVSSRSTIMAEGD